MVVGQHLAPDHIVDYASDTAVLRFRLPLARPVHNLLIAALHIVSDKEDPGATIRIWRDIVLLTRHVELAEAQREAKTARLDGWLRWIITMLPAPLQPPGWLDSLASGSTTLAGQRRLHRLITSPAAQYSATRHALRLPIPNACLYVAGTALPSPAFLRSREAEASTLGRWWRTFYIQRRGQPRPPSDAPA